MAGKKNVKLSFDKERELKKGESLDVIIEKMIREVVAQVIECSVYSEKE